MPSEPVYGLILFNYQIPQKLLSASISQTIDGNVWTVTKSVTGDAAQTIWNARGETEDQLIARILAA